MKALVCKEHGGPETLVVEEVPDPTADRGMVVVDVGASGVNFPDLLIIQGRYQFQAPLPFIPGGELAGTVSAVGEGVTRFSVGDRVVGTVLAGAHAEKIAVLADRLLPLPDAVSFEVGAALFFTYGTMIHALEDRAKLAEGETVLVLGAGGGIGTASIQLAKAMGAKVLAAARRPKLDLCRALGADAVIDYEAEDLKKRAKALSGGGVDVVVDPVGGAFSEPAFRALRWEGRHLVIGFAAGDIPKLPLNLPLLKGASLVGVFWGDFTAREPARAAAQLTRLGTMAAKGEIRPHVSKAYPLAEGAEALAAVGRREVQGKVVLVP